MSARWGVTAGPGEMVALELAPGPFWLEALDRFWSDGVAVLPLDVRLSSSERRRILDLARPAWVLTDSGAQLFAGAPVDPAIGAVVATSGSGGVPKLAELSRDALTAAVGASLTALGASRSDAWVACLTPAHIGGLLVLLRGVILGSPVSVPEGFEASRVTEASAGAYVSLVPAMVRRLCETGADLSGIAAVLVGGGELDEGDAGRARDLGARIVTTYGLTETSGGVVYNGRPIAGTEIRFDGPDRQIELHGPTLMEGYRADPDATGAAFTVDGWFRTGDCGALNPQGLLEIEGRLDDVIRTGSEKVWPGEVEAALRDHPKVGEVAVAGRPHPDWGQQVVAFVVPRVIEEPPSLQELRGWASERMAAFKAPRDLVLLPELPRTEGGKIRRAALPKGHAPREPGPGEGPGEGKEEDPSPGGVDSGP